VLPAIKAPGSEPTVSVVICSYALERWEELSRAVGSVRAQTAPPVEVIVCVDHNEPMLARARTELAGVVAVANHEARGLSGARNSGISIARGDIVAFLDDDAAAAPDWLERLMARYDDPRVLGVGGAIDPSWAAGRPAGFPAEFQWVVGCSYEGLPAEAASVRNLIGANMSIRRSVFDAVGGFSTGIGRVGALPVGCEETELCIRARQRIPGGEFLFEPRARVSHSVPASRATWSYFRSRCFAEGLSKAQVSAVAGQRDGLSSERAYVLRTLPSGFLRGLADAARGDATGLVRAGGIASGLALTAAGYVAGAVRTGRA
jgi:GT2 family glycosyltransferase